MHEITKAEYEKLGIEIKPPITAQHYQDLDLDFSELIGKRWPGYPDECKDSIIREVYIHECKFPQDYTFEKKRELGKEKDEILFAVDTIVNIVVKFDTKDCNDRDYVYLQVVEGEVYKYSPGTMCYWALKSYKRPVILEGNKLKIKE